MSFKYKDNLHTNLIGILSRAREIYKKIPLIKNNASLLYLLAINY